MNDNTNDWTKSSLKRKEQKGCLDYGDYPNKDYFIPKGTHILIKKKNSQEKFHKFTTTKDLMLRTIFKTTKLAIIFAEKNWLLCIRQAELSKNNKI